MNEITKDNIHDYIRLEKRKGIKEITWDAKNWSTLKDFLTEHGFKCYNGCRFLGVTHNK